MIDIAELDELMAAGTPGEWEVSHSDPACVWTYLDHLMICQQATDAALIVALHNAAPGLIAELKAARALIEAVLAAPEYGTTIIGLIFDRCPYCKGIDPKQAAHVADDSALGHRPGCPRLLALAAQEKARDE